MAPPPMNWLRLARRVLLPAAVLSLCIPAPGRAADSPSAAAPPSQGAALTTEDVSAFLDRAIPSALAAGDMAGAVVTIVKDDAVLVSRGYGHADVAAERAVDPARTLFRVGSVAKLLVWTAVMQQVEAGVLDLDRDVNAYLDFPIPHEPGAPITLRHLMTHSAGFADVVRDMTAADPASLQPLGTYLRTHVPARLHPPGQVIAYSNYGSALAAYIVERVSGMPYADYVEARLFQPLGMTRSTLAQPVPEPLSSDLAAGYRMASAGPGTFEFITAAPAGALSTTAPDIARLMRAYLKGGSLDGTGILRPETLQAMFTQAASAHPDLTGLGLGFFLERRNGHRVVWHAGNTGYFHSVVKLLPDQGVGVFFSFNARGGMPNAGLTGRLLWEDFMDRYFPGAPAVSGTSPHPAADTAAAAGSYLPTRRVADGPVGLSALRNVVTVSAGSGGQLQVDALRDTGGKPVAWTPVAPDLWRDATGEHSLAVVRDSAGTVVRMASDYPVQVIQYDRAAWWLPWILPTLQGLAGLFAAAILAWIAQALWSLRDRHPAIPSTVPAWRRWGIRIAVVASLACLVGWATFLTAAGMDLTLHTARGDVWLHLLRLAAILGIAGALLAIVDVPARWRAPAAPLGRRLGATLVGLALVTFAGLALAFDLATFSFQY